MLDLAGEVVANRGDPACALGGDDAPVAFNEVDVVISGMTLDGEEANFGMVRRLDFLVGILCEPKRQPHVRLATAEPDISNENIVQFNGLMACDG